MTALDWRDDRGQVAGIEALPFGVLIFVAGAVMVASLWGVLDSKSAVTAAAREAARAYVEAPNHGAGLAAAEAAASDAITGHGKDPTRWRFTREPDPADFHRCGRATFTVVYDMAPVSAGPLGSFGEMSVSASHSELVDPFRNDVGTGDDEARCG